MRLFKRAQKRPTPGNWNLKNLKKEGMAPILFLTLFAVGGGFIPIATASMLAPVSTIEVTVKNDLSTLFVQRGERKVTPQTVIFYYEGQFKEHDSLLGLRETKEVTIGNVENLLQGKDLHHQIPVPGPGQSVTHPIRQGAPLQKISAFAVLQVTEPSRSASKRILCTQDPEPAIIQKVSAHLYPSSSTPDRLACHLEFNAAPIVSIP